MHKYKKWDERIENRKTKPQNKTTIEKKRISIIISFYAGFFFLLFSSLSCCIDDTAKFLI